MTCLFVGVNNATGLLRYVGVDIAQNSLRQFTERILTNSQGTGRAEHLKVTHLVCADMGTADLTESSLPCHTWNTGTHACYCCFPEKFRVKATTSLSDDRKQCANGHVDTARTTY
jgi:hypothetical protein